jgi:hypothetical protein
MPELSRFFGIIIRMYMEVGDRITCLIFMHITKKMSQYSVWSRSIIAGSLPRRQRRLVEAWAELHQDELLADWQRLQDGETPLPIDPLD